MLIEEERSKGPVNQGKGCLYLIPYLLDIGPFRPGFYVYLGSYTDDRDLKVLGWRGPWKSLKEAKNEVPGWWVPFGHDAPRFRFRLFQPLQAYYPVRSDKSHEDFYTQAGNP